MKNKLKFKTDGSFKIVQFTDLHYGENKENNKKTLDLAYNVIKFEKPDLIIYTGDVIRGQEYESARNLLNEAISPAVISNIPFAMVIGNHDTEQTDPLTKVLTKDQYIDIQQEHSSCMTQKGDPTIHGVGNYTIQIFGNNNKLQWVLFCIDSGGVSTHPNIKGWDYIKRDQIQWYTEKTKKLENKHGSFHSLMFFHIPLQEYKEVWHTRDCYGHKNEAINGAELNSGLFSTMLEMGNVRGVFAGHQHTNDFWGDLYGIKLAYGRCSGYNAYGKDGFKRGARVIVLEDNVPDFRTYLNLEGNETVLNQPLHTPEDIISP